MICLAMGNGYWRLVIKPWYPSGCIGMHGGTGDVLVGVGDARQQATGAFSQGECHPCTNAPMSQAMFCIAL